MLNLSVLDYSDCADPVKTLTKRVPYFFISDRAVIAYWWHGSWRQPQKGKEEEAYKEVEPFVEEFVSCEINRASTTLVMIKGAETRNGEVGLNRPRLAGAGDVQGLLGQCALASMAIGARLATSNL